MNWAETFRHFPDFEGWRFALVIGSIIMGIVYLALPLSSEAALPSHWQQGSSQPTQLGSNAQESLSEAAQKLTAVIEEDKESELPGFWSHSGVSFGIDGAVIGKQSLLRQLQQKQDLYCFFFNTDCLRKNDEEQRRAANAPPRKGFLYSYRDLLRGASSKEVKVSEYRDHGLLLGRVLVNLTMNEKISGERSRVLEFTFAKESGRWRLTSVPYD